MKKIIAIGIISMFLLSGITVASFNLKETEVKSNQPLMINLNNYNPIVNLNDVVSFEISVTDSNSEPASFCNYEVYTRPYEEDISCQRVGDRLEGEFTPTRDGMYSLIVEVTGADNNVKKESFYYFANPASIGFGNVRYYFRDDLPTHGQPIGNGHDCGSLLLTPSTEEENRWCGAWIQFSPDEVPENPISVLINIYIHCLYKSIGVGPSPWVWGSFIGIQKVATCDWETDKHQGVLGLGFYRWITKDFLIFWQIDDASDWYWLSLKLTGLEPSLLSKPYRPSYADFTYIYSMTPNIKSISNKDITVLSATSEAGNSNNAEIILQGTGTTNLVVQMPDKSKMYSATFNGAECDFAQVNGEMTFNLQLDFGQTEYSLDIYPDQSSQSQSSGSTQQSTTGSTTIMGKTTSK